MEEHKDKVQAEPEQIEEERSKQTDPSGSETESADNQMSEQMIPIEEPPEEKAEKLQKELEELKDKYLRLYAEFENYKKRVQKDKTELINYATESIVMELLTVVDNLEMALAHVGDGSSIEALKEGVELTLRELKKVLAKQGVKEIEALGKPFNPELHHAMAQVEREDVEDKTIVEEFRKGYIMKDKVIRPSLVAVAKKIEKSEEASSSEDINPQQDKSE